MPSTVRSRPEKQTAGDVPDGDGDCHLLTLPSVCYMVYKNVNQAASQYYPSPQITVYLDKALDDNAAAQVVGQIRAEQGVEKVNYLSREEAPVSSVTGQALAVRWTCLKRTPSRPWRW